MHGGIIIDIVSGVLIMGSVAILSASPLTNQGSTNGESSVIPITGIIVGQNC